MFVLADHLTELTELVREQRALHVEQLAITRVHDERCAIDTATETHEARDGVSPRAVRVELETARALETLPAIAAAAHAGALSWDQLKPLVEIATPESDVLWAQGRRTTPQSISSSQPGANVASPTKTPPSGVRPANFGSGGGATPGCSQCAVRSPTSTARSPNPCWNA